MLFPHFPAMPAVVASGNKQIPKGQGRWMGLVLLQLCRTCLCLQKHPQLLPSQPHLILSLTGCGKYLLRKPLLNSINLLLLFKNTPKPLAWPFFFTCMGRRGKVELVKSCRTSHWDAWGRWVCKAFGGSSRDNERQEGETRTGLTWHSLLISSKTNPENGSYRLKGNSEFT